MVWQALVKRWQITVIILIALIISFAAGWLINGRFIKAENTLSIPLRLSGYQYIKPLLICDTNPDSNATHLQGLEDSLKKEINKEVAVGNITTASVYFRDLTTNEQIDINGDENFSPASLRKVPLMMAVFKAVEEDPGILTSNTVKLTGTDQNGQQEIKPKDSAKVGMSYTVEQLLEKMIKYSDNNSASALVSVLGVDNLKNVFTDLQVPFKDYSSDQIVQGGSDFITTHKASYFFRVLYNATYLNKDMSEKALGLLSQVDFKDGIVAGTPAGTNVAHKFGLTTISDENKQVTERELHDCGIVYSPSRPYILCVMTKSKAEILAIEGVIKNISNLAYQAVSSK